MLYCIAAIVASRLQKVINKVSQYLWTLLEVTVETVKYWFEKKFSRPLFIMTALFQNKTETLE